MTCEDGPRSAGRIHFQKQRKTHDENARDDTLSQEHRTRVELRLAHLGDDAKAAGGWPG